MAEPTSTATAAVATAAILAMFPGIDAGIVLGAFAGASVFVLSSTDYSALKKMAYLAISFISGVLAAPLASGLLATVLPPNVQASPAVGALLSASLTIKLLHWLIDGAGDPLSFIGKLRGGK